MTAFFRKFPPYRRQKVLGIGKQVLCLLLALGGAAIMWTTATAAILLHRVQVDGETAVSYALNQ